MGCHDSIRRAARCLRPLFNASALGLVLIFGVTGAASAAELHVPIDETKAFVLDQPFSTIAVTNPAIADVTVHNDKILLVVGRMFGVTNIVALDSEGKPVATKRIRVISAAGAGNVTYVRGPGIFSYSCAPRCERVTMPGDRAALGGPDVGPAAFGNVDNEQKSRADVRDRESN